MEPRQRKLWLAVLALAAMLILAIVYVASRSMGSIVVFSFDDASEIRPGAAVKMKGIKIGQVKEIRLGGNSASPRAEVVSIIYPDYKKRIPKAPASTALIAREGVVSGDRFVDVHVIEGNDEDPVESGDVVPGVESMAGLAAWRATNAAKSGIEAIAEFGREKFQKLEEWGKSLDGRKFEAQVSDFLKQVDAAAREGADTAREETGAAIEKGSKLLESLKNGGADDAAKEVQASLDKLKARYQAIEAEAREKAMGRIGDIKSAAEKKATEMKGNGEAGEGAAPSPTATP